jgi:membrane protein implicated in regulation of membrane protease activity
MDRCVAVSFGGYTRPMLSWMWVVWLLAGLVLVGMEVHTQAFYALFLALGAFAATVVALFPTPVWLQAVVGAAIALVGTMAVRPTLARLSARHLGPKLAMPGSSDNLVGQPALTLEAVGDENHPGHARLFNERWLAVTNNPGGVAAHQQVTVVEVRGTTLVVAPPKGG